MTTIAYRDGILAGDGRETMTYENPSELEWIVTDRAVKVEVLPDGRLFGGSKTSTDILTLRNALVKCGGRPTPKLDDINAMLIELDGSIWVYEGEIWVELKEPYYAVGSGTRWALAVMDAGGSAEQAVRGALKRDPFSGGQISTVRLHGRPASS